MSVITPVLDGERFIAGCLENVAMQKCEGVEHLVVDGGSRDATEAIVDEHMRRHASIRWLQEPGANQSRALNLGIEESRGRVVGILNVDDFYEPGTLARVVELLHDLPSPALAVGNCNAWEGGAVKYVNRPADLRFEKLLLGPDFYPFPFNPAAYFYDKSLHELIGPYDVSDELLDGPRTSCCARSRPLTSCTSTKRGETSGSIPAPRRCGISSMVLTTGGGTSSCEAIAAFSARERAPPCTRSSCSAAPSSP